MKLHTETENIWEIPLASVEKSKNSGKFFAYNFSYLLLTYFLPVDNLNYLYLLTKYLRDIDI